MNFETFLALKYIKSSKGREKFISFSSLMSVLGIIVGVAALIIVMGVMNGFDNELEKKIVDVNPHVLIKSSAGVFPLNEKLIKKLRNYKEVKLVYPLLVTQGMLSANGLSTGVVINGVQLNKNNPINHYIIKGSLKKGGAVLGYELAKMLDVTLGQKVRLILPFGKTTPFGFAPLSFQENVTGLFKSGMYDYDSSFVYIPLTDLWSKTSLKGLINTIAIDLKNPFKANEFTKKINPQLPFKYYASNWMELNYNFFTALKLEKIAMFIILLLVIIVAAFNITSSLMMLVMEKTKDVAILRSFGATPKNIKNIFIKQSAIIGIVGIIIGDSLGIFLSYLLKKYHFIELPKTVYYITTIPVNLGAKYIVGITLLSFILIVLSSIYPAHKASKVNIIEVLRQ